MISFLRYLIVRDFWLKLLSFVFAVLIWLTVKKVFLSREITVPINAFGTQPVEQNYVNVPILVIFPAAELRSVDVQPSEVQVTVQAEPRAFQNLKPEDIRAQINLTGIESAHSLRKRVEVILPTGFTYTRVIPDEVEVIVPPKK